LRPRGCGCHSWCMTSRQSSRRDLPWAGSGGWPGRSRWRRARGGRGRAENIRRGNRTALDSSKSFR
jgi:hypothetical protein